MCIRDRAWSVVMAGARVARGCAFGATNQDGTEVVDGQCDHCLLYTSDAADERSSVDLGGRRIIKKKNSQYA